MEAITLPVYSSEGKEIERVTLDSSVFDGKVNQAAIYQAVNNYMANQRCGLAATKTRGEVSGGGKKPWKQKGTGRARVGSTRSPLWRHGGVVFGPHPRDFSVRMPAKIKNVALVSALAQKAKDNNLMVIAPMSLSKPSTKEAVKVFKNLKVEFNKSKKQSTLMVIEKCDPLLQRALRNIAGLRFNLAKDTFAYEVMAAHKVIITQPALVELTKRLKK